MVGTGEDHARPLFARGLEDMVSAAEIGVEDLLEGVLGGQRAEVKNGLDALRHRQHCLPIPQIRLTPLDAVGQIIRYNQVAQHEAPGLASEVRCQVPPEKSGGPGQEESAHVASTGGLRPILPHHAEEKEESLQAITSRCPGRCSGQNVRCTMTLLYPVDQENFAF